MEFSEDTLDHPVVTGDYESLVSIHVTSLNGEPVSFLMESDNKISLTVEEQLDGVIVECFAENMAGIGPVQAKRVDIHCKYALVHSVIL